VPDNSIQHVLNRGNRRQTIFHKPEDYNVFFNLLADTQVRVPMRILAACLMPNHFHLVLWPRTQTELSAYMQLVMTAHVRRHHLHYGTTGQGHIYQGRFKNFMVQSDPHLYRVLRYVEGNPRRAGLVDDARSWRWSSAARRITPHGLEYLTEWPVPRPAEWIDFVNLQPSAGELRRLQFSARKGTPYGDKDWVRAMIEMHDLESTVRLPGMKKLPDEIIATYA
jgi:putative transposase